MRLAPGAEAVRRGMAAWYSSELYQAFAFSI
jgi:hypothetical protein